MKGGIDEDISHRIKVSWQKWKSDFCGSLGINLSTDRIAGRGKVAYIWISPDPAKAGPTLEVVVVVVDRVVLSIG